MMGRDIEPSGDPFACSDAVALDRELFNRVAQTHPGVIRTLGVLLAELSELDGLAPQLARALGEHLRRVGDTVIRRANPASPATSDLSGPSGARHDRERSMARLTTIERRLDEIVVQLDELSVVVAETVRQLAHVEDGDDTTP